MGNSLDNENINTSDVEETAGSKTGDQVKIDMLELFEKATGNEFGNSTPRGAIVNKEIEARKENQMREDWVRHKPEKEAGNSPLSQRFGKVRDFEEKSLKWQGVVFWTVFVMLTLVAVAIGFTKKLF